MFTHSLVTNERSYVEGMTSFSHGYDFLSREWYPFLVGKSLPPKIQGKKYLYGLLSYIYIYIKCNSLAVSHEQECGFLQIYAQLHMWYLFYTKVQ